MARCRKLLIAESVLSISWPPLAFRHVWPILIHSVNSIAKNDHCFFPKRRLRWNAWPEHAVNMIWGVSRVLHHTCFNRLRSCWKWLLLPSEIICAQAAWGLQYAVLFALKTLFYVAPKTITFMNRFLGRRTLASLNAEEKKDTTFYGNVGGLGNGFCSCSYIADHPL